MRLSRFIWAAFGAAETERAPSGPMQAATEQELRFIDEEVYERAGGAVETALFEERISDPRNFVKLKWAHGIEYTEARRLIGKEKVALLHEMLEDAEQAPYWHSVARLIGYVSDDVNSVAVLLRYIQRDDVNAWDWRAAGKKNGYRMVMGKVWALEWIGRIGGEQADGILREALTEEGAIRLTKGWIEGELPEVGKRGGRQEVIGLIRGRAAIGLVYTQKAENIDLVKGHYEKQYALCKRNRTWPAFYRGLACAMADQAFIEENDLESRYRLWCTGTREIEVMTPFLTKYCWVLQEQQRGKQ